MTVTEANAINILLTYTLGDRAVEPTPKPSIDQVRQAADLLADKSYRQLMYGWDAVDVANAFARRQRK